MNIYKRHRFQPEILSSNSWHCHRFYQRYLSGLTTDSTIGTFCRRSGIALTVWFLVLVTLVLASAPLIASEATVQQGVSGDACDTLTVFVRQGCPHCAEAKQYLSSVRLRHPALVINFLDVASDTAASTRLFELSAVNGISRPGVPAFEQCGQFSVGFSAEAGTPELIEARITGEQPAATGRINTPFGEFSVQDVGLPAFTIMVGLVDGFNPCAMWVLLFLLSILVNVKDRTRILLIAGTFVVVSGVVYFAFMAAWLNLFLLIGFARWIQLILGLIAIVMGLVHLKDFIFPGKGLSLSIPEVAKPGLYRRARAVLQARNLVVALVSVTTLAFMVNVVELLCTAGLPALYTQILSQYGLSPARYYGYLALYNLAYVLDDGVMVAIAVVTLRKHKLQKDEGRWLKLLSGVVVIILGALLLFAPGWLF